MKLVYFSYTNELDQKSEVHINPAFVVSVRPSLENKREQTTVYTVCSTINVDGEVATVAEVLCSDYDPAQIKETGVTTKVVSASGRFTPGHARVGGRIKGQPNKSTTLLKDAILRAASELGDGDMIRYLVQQGRENPVAFLSLLGRVLPLQLENSGDNPVTITQVVHLVVDTREQAEAIELQAIPHRDRSGEPN